MVHSFRYMAKPIQYCKVKKKILERCHFPERVACGFQAAKGSGKCPNLPMYIVVQNKIGFITKESGENT